MSMMSCAGASSAAEDIKKIVLQEIENTPSSEAKESLARVLKECDDIIYSANSGWY